MKRSIFCTLVLSLCFLSVGRAQTVTGSGSVGTIPIFTGSSTIGNSPIFQLGGSTSIGATVERLGTKFQVINDSNTSPQPGQGPNAIYGEASGAADFTDGVFGLATSPTGLVFGVAGVSFSVNGVGVHGNHTNPEAQGGGGVSGICESTSGFCFGVQGAAVANTGFAAGGVFSTSSPGGVGLISTNRAGGNIILGRTGPDSKNVFRVDGNGTIFADGGFRPFGADFAEAVRVKGSTEQYAPGDLLIIDASGERRLSLSQTPYSTLVAGIYSTQPGVVASTHRVDEALPNNEVPLAVVGIVPCKVTAENGPIIAGDLLVSSSIAGHAMKGTDRGRMLGAVVGKALEPLQKGTGVIQVLVTLQ